MCWVRLVQVKWFWVSLGYLSYISLGYVMLGFVRLVVCQVVQQKVYGKLDKFSSAWVALNCVGLSWILFFQDGLGDDGLGLGLDLYVFLGYVQVRLGQVKFC